MLCSQGHGGAPNFMEIVQAVKKVQFNLARAIELSETAEYCAQPCIETLYKRATSVAHLTNFSFEFFYAIFTQDAPLPFL